MRIIRSFLLLTCLVLGCLQGCVEEYDLPASVESPSSLVVDGSVLIEKGTAQVKLSRTQNLANAAKAPEVERGAQVTLEDSENRRITLSQTPEGLYAAAGLSLVYGREYRLRIKTSDGKEYLSALSAAQQTPAISALPWKGEGDGVEIQVTTVGADNGTRFYRWEYTETYEYESFFFSVFKYENNQISRRTPSEFIYTCWRSGSSRNIILGTSQQLDRNVINQKPITFVEGASDKLSKKYSILVRQFAISQLEYDYWLLMQKNTENVGSLFDAQPSFVTGNVTCVTDPEEVVFGYFSVQSMQEKRLFIDKEEVRKYNFRRPLPYCVPEESPARGIPAFMQGGMLLLDTISDGPLAPGYTVASRECLDCRVKGGNTIKPAFWP